MKYNGLLYRALNPIYAANPLSGDGAKKYGGRFNPKGTPALYTSLTSQTAIREANQVGTLQPTTIVCYKAEIEPIFDGRDAALLNKYKMTPALLASNTWREEMLQIGKSKTQVFAQTLIKEGFSGLIIPSFAKGAGPDDLNLILWKWNKKKLELVDDEGRLKCPPEGARAPLRFQPRMNLGLASASR